MRRLMIKELLAYLVICSPIFVFTWIWIDPQFHGPRIMSLMSQTILFICAAKLPSFYCYEDDGDAVGSHGFLESIFIGIFASSILTFIFSTNWVQNIAIFLNDTFVFLGLIPIILLAIAVLFFIPTVSVSLIFGKWLNTKDM